MYVRNSRKRAYAQEVGRLHKKSLMAYPCLVQFSAVFLAREGTSTSCINIDLFERLNLLLGTILILPYLVVLLGDAYDLKPERMLTTRRGI
jgi:hypothetical protein